jgi:hypothetical protein
MTIQNFASNVVQMQLNNNLTEEDGSLNQTGLILDSLDFFFTMIFAFELSLNIFAHWFRTFINDGWNWFAMTLDIHSPYSLRIAINDQT